MINTRLGVGPACPTDLAVADAGLDQVDVVLILLSANMLDDVACIVGHPVTRYPPEDRRDPWDIDNWQVERTQVAGIAPRATVRQLVTHGWTYAQLDDMQQQGLVYLVPHYLHERLTGSIEDRAAFLDDWVRRHPDLWDIANWRVTRVGTPPHTEHRPAACVVRVGQTVQQLITRGLRYDMIDEAQRAGWLRLAPPLAAAHG